MRIKLLEIGYRVRNWLYGFFRSDRLEKELEIEMQHHLQSLREQFEREGMSPEAARKAALRGFGNVESLKEDCRDSRGTRIVTDLTRDIRFSVRSLRKSRGFSLTVIATLALCIGANSTIFSVLYELILKPLPFENPGRVVQVYNIYKNERSETSRASWNQYVDFNAHADMFESFVLAESGTGILDGAEVGLLRVTSDFFDFVGVRPLMGRFFTSEEVYPWPGNVIVLTQTAWENDYSADPNIIGKEIKSHLGPSYTIIGVAPRSIERLYPAAKFFAPYVVGSKALGLSNRWSRDSDLWARLKPGVTHEQAYGQLVLVERRAIEQARPEYIPLWEKNPQHFEIGPPHPLKSSLTLLQGGTFLLVVVGCINIINLLLVRSRRRGPELSVRHSFGAGRLSLARMMLTESLLLTTSGLLAGSLLTWGGIVAINRYLIVLFPKAQPVALSGTVFFWTLLMALAIAVIMGLLPFVLLWRSGRIQKMDQITRSSSAGRSVRFMGTGLVVSQIAITFVLLIGAGLLIRSFRNVLDVDPGFDAAQVVAGSINIKSAFPDSKDSLGVRKRILEAMREIPGTENVGFELNPMIVGASGFYSDVFAIQGGSSDDEPRALIKMVGAEYFAAMGIDIVEGRVFYPGVDEQKTSYVIDESFANQYMKDRLAVGTSINRLGHNHGWVNVVGVVARVNYQGLEKRNGPPVVYWCVEENPHSRFSILLRTKRSSKNVIPEIQAKLREINSKLHLSEATSLDKPLGKLNMDRKGFTLLIGVFASLAMFLSTIGIYGMISYDVQQRRREIGIRISVGANQGKVLKMVLRQGFWKAGIGLSLGFVASLYLNRFLENKLFDVVALDPLTYGVVIFTILSVALVASYIPARRAVGVNPVEALRVE